MLPVLLVPLVAAAVGTTATPARAAIYFGDVHAHSALSNDATGAPDAFFRVARDVAGLDFVVLSDHDVFLTPDEAAVLRLTAASFETPGSFIAFSGVEWTHRWHMNVYFRTDAEAYCLGIDGCAGPEGFYAFYGPRVAAAEAAAHVNHPADPLYAVEWDTIDDAVTTNVEVWNTYSLGSQEVGFGNALWALQAGFRLGFVGVSDDHHADAAVPLLGTGLTGCRVDALTRDDLLAALRGRRCYATDGDRIQLDLEVGGVPMGGELAVPLGATVITTVSVMGTDTPAAIEVVRNGAVVATKTDCAGVGCVFSVPVEMTDLRNFVYARVRQTNDRHAWASPVWVRGECRNARECARRLVPGGGASRTDCLLEWSVPPPPGRPGPPTCRDGDPACDAGSAANECTLRVGLCTGIGDCRVRRCRPAPVDRIEVIEPRDDSRSETDVENRKTLLAAVRALGPAPAPGSCTPLFGLRVPIGLSRRGRPVVGDRTVRTVTHGAAGDDLDRLVLRCRPSRR